MLFYTQRSFLDYVFFVQTLNLIAKLLNKSANALIYLFSPEDTSETEGEGRLQITKCNGNNISGIIKALFWIAISISIALLMGRLS